PRIAHSAAPAMCRRLLPAPRLELETRTARKLFSSERRERARRRFRTTTECRTLQHSLIVTRRVRSSETAESPRRADRPCRSSPRGRLAGRRVAVCPQSAPPSPASRRTRTQPALTILLPAAVDARSQGPSPIALHQAAATVLRGM